MRILLSSRYAEPNPIGSNRNVYTQAQALKELGLDVEILTWPVHGYSKDIPVRTVRSPEYNQVKLAGLTYHVVYLPPLWGERVLTNNEWEQSVSFFRGIIGQIAPDLFHLHAVYGMTSSLDAAQRLGIKTVYTVHDFGLLCLRNVLLMSDGRLCDGVASPQKCSRCIIKGRNWLGYLNETLVKLPLVESLLTLHWTKAYPTGFIPRHGGVRMPVGKRVSVSLQRARMLLGRLAGVIVTSSFAKSVFEGYLSKEAQLLVLKWPHFMGSMSIIDPPMAEPFKFIFLGRISPEKGLDILLEAYIKLRSSASTELWLAGHCDSPYARELRAKYSGEIGDRKKIVWKGWISKENIREVVQKAHCGIVPSICQDNVPLALIDILASGRPVICSNTPSMSDVIKDGHNGILFQVGDASSLASAMEKVVADRGLLCHLTKHSTEGLTSINEYAQQVASFYRKLLEPSGRGGLL